MTPVQGARLLLLKVAGGGPAASAAEAADRATSAADARTLLNLAAGVPAADICSLGYDWTRRSYGRVRGSWIWALAEHGYSEQYDLPRITGVIAMWAARRPGFTAGDDWLAQARRQHAIRRPGGCDRGCDWCREEAGR